jgi:hypothetical protein
MQDRIKSLDRGKVHDCEDCARASRPDEVGPDEVGPAEVGPAEVGPAEVGRAEVGPAEVGPEEVGLGEVGPAEVGLVEVGLVEVWNLLTRLEPSIPFDDPLLPALEQFERFVAIHGADPR